VRKATFLFRTLVVSLLVSLLILASIISSACTSPAPTVVLRCAIGSPLEHPGTQLVVGFIEDFNAAADGRYEIKLFAGGTLSSTLGQMDAIRTGAIDMGDAATNFYAGNDAAFGVADVPFLFNNYDAQIEFLKDAMGVLDAIAQEKFNQKLICMAVYGSKDIYSVDKPVRTLEDWQGLLVSVNTPIESDMVNALGGAPVVTDWVDELPSLQKGVINAGIISAPMGLQPMQYSDVINYLTVAGMKGGMNFIAINLDIWEDMPKDIQDLMLECASEYADNFNETFKSTEGDCIALLESEGVTVYYLPEDERDRWVEACQQVCDDYWDSLPQDIAQKFKDFAASANSKFPLE
jgi:TRAP-type C4-dicarboxylate transport system substrate-binding protein